MPGFVAISTLVISCIDVLCTTILACCSGRLKIQCPCFVFEHDEDKGINDDDIEKISENVERRMSSHN